MIFNVEGECVSDKLFVSRLAVEGMFLVKGLFLLVDGCIVVYLFSGI